MLSLGVIAILFYLDIILYYGIFYYIISQTNSRHTFINVHQVFDSWFKSSICGQSATLSVCIWRLYTTTTTDQTRWFWRWSYISSQLWFWSQICSKCYVCLSVIENLESKYYSIELSRIWFHELLPIINELWEGFPLI